MDREDVDEMYRDRPDRPRPVRRPRRVSGRPGLARVEAARKILAGSVRPEDPFDGDHDVGPAP